MRVRGAVVVDDVNLECGKEFNGKFFLVVEKIIIVGDKGILNINGRAEIMIDYDIRNAGSCIVNGDLFDIGQISSQVCLCR